MVSKSKMFRDTFVKDEKDLYTENYNTALREINTYVSEEIYL